jgi:outer membrane receptor for ferrienterochelin and colicins
MTWGIAMLAVFGALAPQHPRATIRVEVRTAGVPVAAADVVVAGRTYRTNADGVVLIDVPPGTIEITIVKEDLVPVTTSIAVMAGQVQPVLVDLPRQPTVEERVTVSATRTDKRLADQPMRVEVLDKEDLEEEQSQTPGDIVMVMNEKAGLRVQTTSPGLGAASIRIQGMRGRYTRVLSDGLPLFGADVGGIGLLQTPPADLGQIEVIKGVASALYGPGALGGVIDLISRRPETTATQQVLVNRSSLGATDAVLFATQPFTPNWSGSLLVSGNWQDSRDVDGDGWADVAGYSRGVVRPRVFWDDKSGRSLFATAGVTWEQRTGGTVAGAVLPGTGAPYTESLQTSRLDAGFVAQTLVGDQYVLTARASVTQRHQDHLLGDVRERERADTLFGELALRGKHGSQTWVGGVAFERQALRPDALPQFAYAYAAPGLFAQDDIDLKPWLSVSASGRVDVHSQFGTFLSPRVSALLRDGGWSSRVSAGTGFFAPTPLSDDTEAAGLTRLTIPTALKAERGRSASWDVTRTLGPLSVTGTLFHSTIADPVVLDRQRYALENVAVPTVNTGGELLATWRHEPFSVTTTYTYVHAMEGSGTERGDVPLTPRHSAGLFGVWEEEELGRVALEVFYTGRQRLEDDPFRSVSEPYVLFGGLFERRFHHLRLFVNAENLGNVRQTQWGPLIRPTRAQDGRWTVDAWAPLDGRVINGGVRIQF